VLTRVADSWRWRAACDLALWVVLLAGKVVISRRGCLVVRLR
jgi:hypothetical protein